MIASSLQGQETEDHAILETSQQSFSALRRMRAFMAIVVLSMIAYFFSDASLESDLESSIQIQAVSNHTYVSLPSEKRSSTTRSSTRTTNISKSESTTKEATTSKTAPTSTDAKKSKQSGLSFLSMLNYISESASQMYPNNMPNHLWLIKEVQPYEKYIFLQSMSTYWKQAHAFRKRQNPLNYELFDEVFQQLNKEAPYCISNVSAALPTNGTCTHGLLYRRIHEAGGSLPFFLNWRLYYSVNDTRCAPQSFPILQRATPSICGNATEYWTIPTAPLWGQVPKKEVLQLGRWGAEPVKKSAVVVAIPHDDAAILPPNATDSRQEALHQLQALQTSDSQLAEKLVFPPKDDKEPSYENYAAVLSLDTTSSLYPSILCQSTSSSSPVLLLRHPQSFVDAFSASLAPWIHFIPVLPDWSDLPKQIDYALDAPKAARIAFHDREWCERYFTHEWMAERVLDSLAVFVEQLDLGAEPAWTEVWKNHSEDYLKGHWLRRPGGDSWSLPKSIVGEIKHSGLRADDSRAEEVWNQ